MPASVSFFSNVPDRIEHACRWVRRALQEGASVQVVAEPAALHELDQRLWTFDPQAFVPHVRARAMAAVPSRLRDTPVALLESLGAEPPRPGAILLNLGASVPAGFEPFERVVEIVSQDPQDRAEARTRWRQYEAAGCTLTNQAL